MRDPSALPCVLVVADRERVGELVAALSELPGVEVVVSSGGDDTVELFAARRPAVVLMTASLEHGDARSLIATLRAQPPGRAGAASGEPAKPPAHDSARTPPRSEVAIVVVGDDAGPIRTALDALELAPDRFVSRPLSPRALRFAVTGGIDTVRAARGAPPPPPPLRPVPCWRKIGARVWIPSGGNAMTLTRRGSPAARSNSSGSTRLKLSSPT